MVQPRDPRDFQRIVKAAKSKTAEADLREYDRLLAARIEHDPSVEPTNAQRKANAARERRLKVLAQRLSKGSRKPRGA
jgi:hypothetical protein